jgi:hypothetical protein
MLVRPLVTVANCEQVKGLLAHNSADYCMVRAVTCIDPDLLAAELEVAKMECASARSSRAPRLRRRLRGCRGRRHPMSRRGS